MLGGRNFNIGVAVAPQEWHAGEPVLSVDELTHASEFGWPQETRGSRRFRAGDFPADGGRRNLYLRVVAEAFAFSGFAVRHEVEFVAFFGEPDGREDGDAAFSECRQTDIPLLVDFWGNIGHGNIVA